MKSSLLPFLAGSMTVFGVWMIHSNRRVLDRLSKCIGDVAEQTIQKFKAKDSSCECQDH